MATGRAVTIRFYAELNDLLPMKNRQELFAVPFAGDATVKHLVESLGVPHTEVDLVLVNDASRGRQHGSPGLSGSRLKSRGDVL